MSVYARGPLVNVSCTVYYYRISRNKKGWTNPLMVRGWSIVVLKSMN